MTLLAEIEAATQALTITQVLGMAPPILMAALGISLLKTTMADTKANIVKRVSAAVTALLLTLFIVGVVNMLAINIWFKGILIG